MSDEQYLWVQHALIDLGNAVNAGFVRVEQRLDRVERRLDIVELKVESLDRRLTNLETRVDEGFRLVDRRLHALEAR